MRDRFDAEGSRPNPSSKLRIQPEGLILDHHFYPPASIRIQRDGLHSQVPPDLLPRELPPQLNMRQSLVVMRVFQSPGFEPDPSGRLVSHRPAGNRPVLLPDPSSATENEQTFFPGKRQRPGARRHIPPLPEVPTPFGVHDRKCSGPAVCFDGLSDHRGEYPRLKEVHQEPQTYIC